MTVRPETKGGVLEKYVSLLINHVGDFGKQELSAIVETNRIIVAVACYRCTVCEKKQISRKSLPLSHSGYSLSFACVEYSFPNRFVPGRIFLSDFI